MRKAFTMAAIIASLIISTPALSNTEIALLKQQLDTLKKNYEQRIEALESRLIETEKRTQYVELKTQEAAVKPKQSSFLTQNSFNPAISLILDGRFADMSNDPDDYALPGFMLGGESGLGSQGFAVGESELVMSANIDNTFYGKATLGFHNDDGSTEVDLEEAYIQTLGLGNGLTIKAGRFFSAMGYLNEHHVHTWDFADAPLIYRGLFGDQLRDDGIQLSYIAPTETFLQLGAEIMSGSQFPSAGEQSGIGAATVFANIGGDIGIEHSWQLGLSHWQANNIEGRTGGGHAHGEDDSAEETPSFDGDSKINAVDFVYKWAPNGNPKNQHVKVQFEYFDRKENGTISMLNSGPPLEETSFDGHQKGWYAQTIYQFKPRWRAGLRYDQLESDNTGFDDDVLMEAGLDSDGFKPKRMSAMIEWLPSEFSRIRLQFNRDKSYQESDDQIFLQYTTSLGSHGAHQY
ncbi:hypothetical protein [Cycloclasticus pugetii]|uniref:hypothetical protein n=1 Tax=Cycloclasticus pugetii TaxID=34068 RepID=UPI002409CFE2|nr:hypothetical protein [Cycloclasticus pugetii]MDF1829216.1 hypothetical protein [Cycloclasticus pugetii]